MTGGKSLRVGSMRSYPPRSQLENMDSDFFRSENVQIDPLKFLCSKPSSISKNKKKSSKAALSLIHGVGFFKEAPTPYRRSLHKIIQKPGHKLYLSIHHSAPKHKGQLSPRARRWAQKSQHACRMLFRD